MAARLIYKSRYVTALLPATPPSHDPSSILLPAHKTFVTSGALPHPFEGRITDFPTTTYTRTIERDLRSLLGEGANVVPEKMMAVVGYLF
ncbi:hypothetical protein M427DRAFT_30056 [Gonapodya prolifera JEL478]|uniref:Uncharacterized protein n=1 Tax=Gonapodya prolifera (strain JEL478) TaxID=1344416 RepID=A0A139AMV4_GONPJ|nr:hypothetical protein M427DRAFT_30056 [Gonapodya prolifera JEL478]|eukprot:KXS17934.1 hypothetical protein M427DRAFT_30056 [Gonapodya prolifera JEL478]